MRAPGPLERTTRAERVILSRADGEGPLARCWITPIKRRPVSLARSLSALSRLGMTVQKRNVTPHHFPQSKIENPTSYE